MSYIGKTPTPAPLTSSDITDGIITTAKIADSSVTTEKIVADTNFRNIIINGSMDIAQRGTSVTGITGSSYNTIDRFQTGASSAGTWTQSQSTDVPTGQGFATSLKMDCTTANTSLGSSARLQISQKIEGQNLQFLKKGTSSAVSTTVSFWVKSNKTGIYIVELYDSDNTRHIAKSYTISSANTWEKKTLTYAGDTTGAFGNDNGDSLALYFWLVAGSTFNASGNLATSWSAISNSARASDQVNLADSTSNEWYVTGVQLEAGSVASDFEFLPVDVNLQRCQRYYHKWVSEHVYANITIGKVQSGKNARGVYQNKVQFRTAPSLSADGNFRMVGSGTGTGTGSNISVIRNNTYVQFLDFVFSGGTDSTGNQACEMGANNDADAEIAFSAEL